MTLTDIRRALTLAGISDAATDARLLLSHFCQVSPAEQLAHPEREYESEALKDAVLRRAKREPLQHILGEAYFFGERYTVSADCLVPRADTEILVEYACRRLPKGALFADLCTGSGCIALSVLKHRPDLTAVAADISQAALAVAKKNAEDMGLSARVRFFEVDLLSDALPFSLPDFALSNPPYIKRKVLSSLSPELAYEPQIALDGGDDGLLFYRAFLSRFSPACFLFEIGFDQGKAMSALGEEAGYRATVHRDFGGNDRLVVLEKA